ncbi:4a-hydroxytetrahydrobiopterin dehydratase [Candidatus Poribacteria bacterium]|nr:4a-hydroxytetrahydrobiopterin dehydratase [Candidatus Poribacteria bacterium]
MTRGKLTADQVQSRLSQLDGWCIRSCKLHKTFQFSSFIEAFGFMAQLALAAESMNHHPEWSNIYNKVSIDLITHDVDGISELDFQLARKADDLA